jgi:hypothetical protein
MMATERTLGWGTRRALRAAMGSLRGRTLAAVLLVLVGMIGPALAAAQSIPSNLRAAILLRALQYEKVFASSQATATLLVLSGAAGGKDGAEMAAALRQLAQAGAAARKVVIDEVRGESSAAELAKRAPTVLYVAEGNEQALGVAAAVPGAIVLCGDPGAVGKGCILSVEPFGSSSRLVVDTAAASKKGLTFDARMLRVARVIR